MRDKGATSVYCGGCGAAIDDSAKFCRSCGADQVQFADAGQERPPTPTASLPASSAPTLGSPWRTAAGQRRSMAWIYYALIAIGALIVGFHHAAFLLVAIVAGLYSMRFSCN